MSIPELPGDYLSVPSQEPYSPPHAEITACYKERGNEPLNHTGVERLFTSREMRAWTQAQEARAEDARRRISNISTNVNGPVTLL